MSMPWYVPAEQMMKDKADFARKGIARGRALVAMAFADGILICAENSSSTLRKVSEIYDRIAFAGAGKYNEYDRLRIAGVRHADLKGYSYSREDVDAQSLANAYAQMLGDVFTHEIKPMEVEIVVAELGATPDDDRMFHILYDGTVVDEQGYTVLGGEAEAIVERVKATYEPGRPLDAALRAAVGALAGTDRQLDATELEVAALTRGNGRRAFRRLPDTEVASMLRGGDVTVPASEPPAGVPPAATTAAETEAETADEAEVAEAEETPPDPGDG
jgi:proteasome alpha subunit